MVLSTIFVNVLSPYLCGLRLRLKPLVALLTPVIFWHLSLPLKWCDLINYGVVSSNYLLCCDEALRSLERHWQVTEELIKPSFSPTRDLTQACIRLWQRCVCNASDNCCINCSIENFYEFHSVSVCDAWNNGVALSHFNYKLRKRALGSIVSCLRWDWFPLNLELR